MAMLLALGDDGAVVRTHGLRQRETTVGRGLANSVPIPDDPAVSSFHACIQRTPNGYEIQDQNSCNGTWINGERVERHLLENNDEIMVGSTVLRFVLRRAEARELLSHDD